MKTCRAVVAERREAPDKLNIYRPGRWARINLGWDWTTGVFLGWYVNFELPPTATPLGICSKDLVLDMWVDRDLTWRWKDAADYRRALDDHILDSEIEAPIGAEIDVVLEEIRSAAGPFSKEWTHFRPGPEWPQPELPIPYAWGGSEWTLPPGDRLKG